ncbi:hypothetical protein BGX21_007729 [Mortierella sp. AD011]|nr:hypothetical protein BGX20_008235 [Mortierella sp. AD010]KAF9402984.1 hypothetical protein BGX21_007729 [Mortierella sp. AD011]
MALFNSQWASALVELPTLTFHHALLPLSIFFTLHGIRVTIFYRQAIKQAAEQSADKPPHIPWGQALLSVLAMALGGGSTTSVLLGMPPSWLGSNIVIPTYALSFFLVQYTPLYDFLMDFVPPAVLDSVLIIADGSLRALSIAKLGVDGSRMRFLADSHQGGTGGLTEPWFAMLLLGMISGSGGGMLADLLRLKTHQWTFSTPSFVHAVTFDMKASLLSSFFYAASTSPQLYSVLRGSSVEGGKISLLEGNDAKAMTMLVMCTLMLGQRAEPTIYRLTGFSPSPSRWIGSLQTKIANGSRRDTNDNEDETVKMTKVRHGDETAEEEEEEGYTRRSTRGRRKSGSVSKRLASPEPAGLSVDIPTTRNSTRIRKSVRKDL